MLLLKPLLLLPIIDHALLNYHALNALDIIAISHHLYKRLGCKVHVLHRCIDVRMYGIRGCIRLLLQTIMLF